MSEERNVCVGVDADDVEQVVNPAVRSRLAAECQSVDKRRNRAKVKGMARIATYGALGGVILWGMNAGLVASSFAIPLACMYFMKLAVRADRLIRR